ncbi:glycosyltransferase [Clostridium sp.]|uniref:glycosyltransferase n=1 Tax=Clostridium sp. TaxID=1506 RepID=UPI0032162A36
MKIIHVEDYFDATAGYQINELLNVSKSFESEVFLITSKCMKPFHKELNLEDDYLFEKNTGIKIIRLDHRFIISSRVFLKGLFKTINKINPDVVYFHGIGDFKDLMLLGKKKKYVVVRDCHMSWVASRNKFRKSYFKIFKLLLASRINKTDKYKKIYALGIEEKEYLGMLGIEQRKIDYLYHGYNDEVIYYDEKERKKIRSQYKIQDDEIVISYIGKFNNFKRPDLIFDIIDNLDIQHTQKKINLLFIGSKDQGYMCEFNNRMEKVKSGLNIIIDSSKPFNELKNYFSASDICIFPKETTLSSIHAQVCGCTVIMENHISNIERVVENENLYEIDDYKQAAKILEKVICNNEYIKERNVNIVIGVMEKREYKSQLKALYKLLEVI